MSTNTCSTLRTQPKHTLRTQPKHQGRLRRNLSAPLAALLCSTAPALAEEPAPERELPRLGMAPGEPQVRSAAPTIPFGIAPSISKDNVLDFHGYLLLPLRIGVLKREDPNPGQTSTAIHAPPVIPQDLRAFEYLGVVPDPWVQLNFTYGNRTVAGTVILAAQTLTDADGIYNPPRQLGINDAYISVNLSEPVGLPLEVKVGAVTGRYGAMGAYDAGRYATPLIARTNLIGETITAALPLDELTLVIEQGLGGQLGRPPEGLVPAGWNDYADPNVGASFVHHLHGGLSYQDLAQFGLHYFTAWSQDDTVSTGLVPDGRINVYGADVRLTHKRGGHFYVGAARTDLTNAGTVSGVIEVLNARGGPELTREYLGPRSQGDGALTTFGAQYDLSLASLVYGDLFQGVSPDLRASLYGVATNVASDDPDYDGVLKLKVGSELTYNLLSWFSVSGRFDHVRLDMDNDRAAFSVLSPRLLFHTDWQSRDEFALQYSRFVYGSDVVVKTGSPPIPDPGRSPDQDVFSLSGTFWW